MPGPSQPGLLQSNPPVDTLTGATPAKRKRGKSLSRRTGQDGHSEKSGKWFVVRFWKDIGGQDKRMHVRERVCPISGPGLLSKSERKRKAREIIQASGADSADYFKEVVKQDTGVTFREQSEIWLQQSRTRKPNRFGQLRRRTFREHSTNGFSLKSVPFRYPKRRNIRQ